jgi:two-component system CheB/CheR fusion protein
VSNHQQANQQQQNPHLETLLEYLRKNRGLDLTAYKRGTLDRRIDRRMQQVNVGSVPEYLDYLEVHPEEFGHLFNTILINVTSFFRDPEAWDVLARQIIPTIVAGKPDGEPIRIWSAGCASGEEAFSLAMLWAEHLGVEEYRRRVKIYASDVDADALTKARQGNYDAKQIEALPPELRDRYFEKSAGRYTFRSDTRRSVIFGRHDLIHDAPISHLDLITCRNTLIYLNAETQSRILTRFHHALNERGFLFLGKAELLLTHVSLFYPVDAKHRFFSKAPQGELRERLLALALTDDPATASRLAKAARLGEEALSALPLAQLVVDGEGALILVNQLGRRMFGLGARDIGRPFQDLEVSYQPLELRSLIQRVREERKGMRISDVERTLPGGQVQHVDVELMPLLDNGGDLLGVSVVFDDRTEAKRMQTELQRTSQELENAYEELQSTNEELQSTNEELETTNEELQSTVEELETTNEELQSTNEEHETMNEELQATNEELQAINEQLRGRTDELNQSNALLETILSNLAAGAVVVDRGLKILIWNKKSEDLWGLRSEETRGQPLGDLEIGLPVSTLLEPLRACLNGSTSADQLTVDAIDRRGRSIHCRVTLTPLMNGGEILGVITLMEVRN